VKNKADLRRISGRISEDRLWSRFATAYAMSFMRKPVAELLVVKAPERPQITREELEISGALDEIRAEAGPRFAVGRTVELTSRKTSLMAEIMAAAERELVQTAETRLVEIADYEDMPLRKAG
jgi:hypothetical protein